MPLPIFTILMHHMLRIFFTLLLSFLVLIGTAQETRSDSTPQAESHGIASKPGFIGLPVLFYLPETGIGGGLAGIYFFRFKGVDPSTRLSSVQMLGHITQTGARLLTVPYEFHLDRNKHIIKGRLSWFKYPYFFYGIGPDAPQENEELFTTSSLWLRAYYLYQVRPNFFTGLYYRMDNTYGIEIESEDGLLAPGNILGSDGGLASGLGAVVSYDVRDNIYTPTVGPFIEATVTLNRPWLGSDFNFVRFELDARHYLRLPKHQILAFHGVLDASWGELPFESLGLVGHFTINRGYYEGRFRDKVMGAVQGEWRVPIFRGDGPRESLKIHQRFSVALFGSLANVSPTLGSFSLNNVKYAYGGGIRFLVQRKENVTVRFDYGRGLPGNDGFYFMIGEAF